ncbi:SDR family oxidoreductase [Thermomonas aquatica]|uniref:SDR family oxidoreductase n=1 Tax=Thermomonas aquatica TaxID=2202149 RepID=A0A5B7ZSZ5_9GAMM|nr:SDR family oxidoreductase [Thermomonas aquatica]QDA58291.1 SDR family oxidoreductase [Thermomonas aquatica]
MSGKRIFITGGASGLGRALAERHARAGWKVCIGDLDAERCADALAAIRAHAPHSHALACDVTREDALQAAADWLQREWGGVDVVVNNAGVAQMGGIGETTLEDWQWAVDINLLGVVRGCKVFAPVLKAQGGGQLVNIASMAGLVHLPQASAYNATKAAVVALSETLQLELEPDNIGVSVVCPAFFRTDLARNMRAANPALEGMTKRLVERARIGADEIADRIFDGMQRGDPHILTHPEAKRFWRLKRLLPYRLYLALMRRQLARVAARMQRKAAS